MEEASGKASQHEKGGGAFGRPGAQQVREVWRRQVAKQASTRKEVAPSVGLVPSRSEKYGGGKWQSKPARERRWRLRSAWCPAGQRSMEEASGKASQHEKGGGAFGRPGAQQVREVWRRQVAKQASTRKEVAPSVG